MSPRVLILRAPGTNCDEETAFAFEKAGANPTTLHVNAVLASPKLLDEYQILCIPGGFSYGDDLAAGRIFGNHLRLSFADGLRKFRDDGKLILGICNGFQVLLKSGLLLEDDPNTGPPATLAWNDSRKYEDRWVRLRTRPAKCAFLQGIDEWELPVAHAEGKFITRDAQTLESLDAAGQIVLRYTGTNGSAIAYPENPNGSESNVAGLCDSTGRVLGMMPHPERHLDYTNHPCWTRRDQRGDGDGFALFENAVKYFC